MVRPFDHLRGTRSRLSTRTPLHAELASSRRQAVTSRRAKTVAATIAATTA
jgi:hypothetical protein